MPGLFQKKPQKPSAPMPPSPRAQTVEEEQGMPRRAASPRRTPPPQNRKSNVLRVLTALGGVAGTLVLCVFLAIFILQSAKDLFGLGQVDQAYDIVIPENIDMKDIADILYDAGVVDQKLTFRLYAGIKAKDLEITPGEYVFNANLSYDQIFSMLRSGNLQSQIVSITFIEGLSVAKIAQTLEEKGVCKADDFLEYLQSDSFQNYRFANLLPDDDHLYFHLEGYIFPDTYQFYVNEKVDSVAKKFLDNFELHMTPERIARMETIKMSMHEVITLASIIQKESGDSSEMRKVSSVFHNRLDSRGNFPKLQSDVTIFYVEDYIKGYSRPYTVASTQEVYDAYNTYVCDGLPVGPVCNPGVDAIMAALYPAETNFYYFVTDVEGEYYYASTLSEHQANIAIAEEQDTSGQGKIGGILTHDPAQDAQK